MTEPSASARETRTLEILDTLVQQPAVPVMADEDWVVVSFHTVPAEELIEERPDEAGVGTNQRHYVRQ